jgi:hypothetical protein
MGLAGAVMAKDEWVERGILVRVAAGQVAASHVAGSAVSSFVLRAKNCRSGARGVG